MDGLPNSRILMGVSVVICGHNSAERLPRTLEHLANQDVPSELQWEVILVDNASIDGTSETALRAWPANNTMSIRIVQEPKLGLAHARMRGFAEAKHEIVSFIDDDNWVCREWVRIVSEVMTEHPEVGACGGYIEAVHENNPPWWFDLYKESYVIGPQGEKGGDISNTRGWLCGAGLNVRKSAWQQLVSNGFHPKLVGRKGKALSAGEDKELCYALRLAGWQLWYEPRLRLRHFLPKHRLKWAHLRRLHRGYGAQEVRLFPYHLALKSDSKRLHRVTRRAWNRKIFVALRSLKRHRVTVLKLFLFRLKLEGEPTVLDVEQRIGFLIAMLRTRRWYENLGIRSGDDSN